VPVAANSLRVTSRALRAIPTRVYRSLRPVCVDALVRRAILRGLRRGFRAGVPASVFDDDVGGRQDLTVVGAADNHLSA